MINLDFFIELATKVGLKIIGAVAIIVFGFIVAGCVSAFIQKRQKLDVSVRSFLSSFSSLAIKILAVISALFALGVPAASFVTVLGSVGLAVGLAMQGALSNFAGGILLVVFRPFKVGDHVTVSGQSGIVQSISIFYTTILADDNTVVTLPNGTLTNAPIVNTSLEDVRRLSLEYTVAFDADVEAAKKTILSAVSKNSAVLSGIAPNVTASSHVADKVTLKLTAWTRSADFAKASDEVANQVKTALESEGIKCE